MRKEDKSRHIREKDRKSTPPKKAAPTEREERERTKIE
jgi:hypothetical protein